MKNHFQAKNRLLISLSCISRNVFNVFAIVLISVLVAFELYRFLMAITPPMRYDDVTLLSTAIKQGEKLHYSFSVDRKRACRTEVDRFVISDSGKIVWRDTIPSGTGDVGKYSGFGFAGPLNDIAPGNYVFFAHSHSWCQEGIHMAASKKLAFTVVK